MSDIRGYSNYVLGVIKDQRKLWKASTSTTTNMGASFISINNK